MRSTSSTVAYGRACCVSERVEGPQWGGPGERYPRGSCGRGAGTLIDKSLRQQGLPEQALFRVYYAADAPLQAGHLSLWQGAAKAAVTYKMESVRALPLLVLRHMQAVGEALRISKSATLAQVSYRAVRG